MTTQAAAVRRPLHLTSPLMAGDDVKELQQAMLRLFIHLKIDWLPLADDGQDGRQTEHAAGFLVWALGLGAGHRDPITKRHTITKATQHLLRNPDDRSRLEKLRAKRRAKKLAKIRKAQSEGPDHAVSRAEAWIGTTESPEGSNEGPTKKVGGETGGITFWERYWGLGACYWCLVFAMYFVRAVGGARFKTNAVVNAAEVERMAKAHIEGFVAVPFDQRRRGDVILCCFDGSGVPDHGELCRNGEGGQAETHDVGGNTSFEGGSQSNGGAVALKIRERAVVTCVARPFYPGK
jgi:cell wall-associated NlpC family hydrolase